MESGFIWGALLGAAGMWLISRPGGTSVGFNLAATPGDTQQPGVYNSPLAPGLSGLNPGSNIPQGQYIYAPPTNPLPGFVY